MKCKVYASKEELLKRKSEEDEDEEGSSKHRAEDFEKEPRLRRE